MTARINALKLTGVPQPSKLHGTITKTVLVDVDATLMDNATRRLEYGEFGPAVEGGADCLAALRDAGWTIVIWTTRKADRDLARWLQHNGIPYHLINTTEHNSHAGSCKPECGVLIDDRAWPMCGRQFDHATWTAVKDTLLSAG